MGQVSESISNNSIKVLVFRRIGIEDAVLKEFTLIGQSVQEDGFWEDPYREIDIEMIDAREIEIRR